MSWFSEETAVSRIDDGLWRGELHEGWLIGQVPNGGYVLAVAGRVLSEALPHRDPLAVNAFYLAPTIPGPIDCRLEVLRRGRNTTHAEVKMYQQGELRVQVTAAYTDLNQLSGPDWSAAPRPRYRPIEECTLLQQRHVRMNERVERRLDRGGEVFQRKDGDGGGEFTGWIAHADGADPDALSLLLFADVFPPPIFTVHGPLHWVPTIELSVQVRAHPAPGPIQARLFSRHMSHGVIEEDGEYWDSSGALVALSRQTAKVRLP